MKSIIVFIGLCVALASGKVIIPKSEEGRYAYVPDNNGIFYLADVPASVEATPRFYAFKNINLLVYTRENPTNPDVIKNGDIAALADSHLDITKPIKFIIHGWLNDWDSDFNVIVTDAFLKALDVNVIVVDWSYGGSTIVYPVASARVERVGVFVAAAIDWLVEFGAPLKNFHVIGHSLGAHAAGFTGRNVKSGSVPYITGLDPAHPLWATLILYNGISKADGEYVEIMHTDSGIMGILLDVGHTDFYPNGGGFQPGCMARPTCSHSRAYKFFADSLDHTGFMATKCTSVAQATVGKCRGDKLHMGGADPKSLTGIYYLMTNKQKPYYKGQI